MKRSLLSDLIAAAIILLLVYASFSKYADFEYFKQSMHNQPFPGWLAVLLIWMLPPAEIMIALGLTAGIFSRRLRIWGLCCFLVLMMVFTAYIGMILLHLLPRVPCSCGELIRSMTWGQHFLFNLFFIFLAAAGIRLEKPTQIQQTEDVGVKSRVPENISRAKPGNANT